MSDPIKEKMKRILDELDTAKDKDLPKADEDSKIQHRETIEYSTWKTPMDDLEKERARLADHLGAGLSMLQPLELLGVFQILSDAIRAMKMKEMEEITDVKGFIDKNGTRHVRVENLGGSKLSAHDRVIKLMRLIIRECEVCISMIDNMEQVAMMLGDVKQDESNKEVANA